MRTVVTPIYDVDLEALRLEEFCLITGLTEPQVLEMVEIGVLVPISSQSGPLEFTHQALGCFRRIRRLEKDFELRLDLHALALGYKLVERIEELEALLHQGTLHASSRSTTDADDN